MVKSTVAALILLIASMAVTAGIARAGIGVEPTVSELVIKADTINKYAYMVTNDSDAAVHVVVQIEDWMAKRTHKQSKISVNDWLSVTPMEFDIDPRGSRQVEYTIKPPAGAQGEVVAMVFFATSATSADSKMGVTSRVGVSIYAAFEGDVELGCDITRVKVIRRFETDEKDKKIDKGLAFVINLENQGNVHIRPTGKIIITGEKGNVEEVEIKRNFPIFPQGKGAYTIAWEKAKIAPGKYKALISLDYGKIFNVEKYIEKSVSFVVKENGKVSF